jgi:hypothetical protein
MPATAPKIRLPRARDHLNPSVMETPDTHVPQALNTAATGSTQLLMPNSTPCDLQRIGLVASTSKQKLP